MLSPETRAIAMDLLRPPAGYRIDQAVLTTYSLDLDVLLALPLAVLAQSDQSIEQLLEDPLLLLEALREAGDRVHVFVDEGGIAIPHTSRALYALLERSVHPVRAPNGGAFHPKLWVVRFANESGSTLLRAAVSSRNLTFDRSWDVALVSDGVPGNARWRRPDRWGACWAAFRTSSCTSWTTVHKPSSESWRRRWNARLSPPPKVSMARSTFRCSGSAKAFTRPGSPVPKAIACWLSHPS
jgi:hypothetical protein